MPPGLLTNSAIRTFRRCAREYQLRYALGYRPVTQANEVRFGTLTHKGQEAWWSAPLSTRLDAALSAIGTNESDPIERVRAEELMRGYHHQWIEEPYETLAVEAEFVAPLLNPETQAPSRTWLQAGKIDVIARHIPTGRGYVIEHKTSSEQVGPGSEYWERLTLDGQISGYLVGARSLGFDVDGCIYDVLARPMQRAYRATPDESRKYTKFGVLYSNQRDTDETPENFRARVRTHIADNPERYYQRGEVVRFEDEAKDAAFDVWQTGRLIRDAELAKRWPRNPDSCLRFGRRCSFFDVCTRTASLDDETRYRRTENVHEELTLAGSKEESACPQ